MVIKHGDFTIDDSCILNFYPEQDMFKVCTTNYFHLILIVFHNSVLCIMHFKEVIMILKVIKYVKLIGRSF